MASRTQAAGVVQQAIANAANRYQEVGVPASLLSQLLSGIWQRESGSAYPNPWENGLGYGGEFGTRMGPAWGPTASVRRVVEPPVQDQADTAAQILAANIRSHGGDVGKALSAYSGGGYSSVTPGTESLPASLPQTPVTAAPARPGTGTGGGGGRSWWGDIEHAAGSALGGVEGAVETAAGDVESAASWTLHEAEGAVDGWLSFLKALVWLISPLTWLRGVEAGVGVLLIALAVALAAGVDKAVSAVKGAGIPAE